jgi:hypothetical protein
MEAGRGFERAWGRGHRRPCCTACSEQGGGAAETEQPKRDRGAGVAAEAASSPLDICLWWPPWALGSVTESQAHSRWLDSQTCTTLDLLNTLSGDAVIVSVKTCHVTIHDRSVFDFKLHANPTTL